ncbi:LPXTG cell wall anchor domain-containing protein [Lactobacillus gallinarum]|uniref:LPXTG cell wall anchor domain-containing protein n=1 Tax=Lactobacillus gallinarum TaxID=52242 RepID=UPI00242F0EB3|nr:LPXTG cell wall anchor domain-containing protein [Lactobacillus gallinarum]
MFKSTKSQFAIRKLSKGAVAVLLTFGIFANTTSGIVSATVNDGIDISAIEIRGGTTDTTESSVEDITPESTTEVSTSNDDQSTPVNSEITQNTETISENTQVETATEINKAENTAKEESTVENATTNDATVTEDQTTTDKTETSSPENTNQTETTTKKPTINVDTEKVDKEDEEETKKLEDIKKYIEEVAAKHPLGIAGIFHIFGNEVDGQVHIAGNIAADKVGAGDFGTNSGATSNLTNGDIHYIGSIDHLNKINGDNKLVIFGPDIEYRSYENGGAIQVNFGTKDEPKWQKVDIKHSHIIQADKPLDIQGELDKLGEKSDNWASQSQTEGVKADFTDHNNSWIDVSEAIKNAGDRKEPIYVTVDASHISGDNKRNITIKGIPAGENAPIIILNVTNVQNGDLTVKTHLVLEYSDQNNVNGSSEKHGQANKLLWNFGTNLNSLNIDGDCHLGSILASNAHITTNVNVDGNIIGDKVTIKGESHRWDLVPPMEEIQIPEEPKPEEPTPEEPKPEEPTPEDPTPEDPTPEEPKPEEPTTPPTDEELPPSEEDFIRPLPEDVVDPIGEEEEEKQDEEDFIRPLPEDVVDPIGEEEEEKQDEEDFIRPLPEDVVDPIGEEEEPKEEEKQDEDFIRPLPENVVKSATNKVQEQQKEEKATPQTSTSTVVETSTEEEIALPETGEKQNPLISIGAVMSAVAVALLSLGLIIKKKN